MRLKKILLPELIMSAEAAGRAFDILKSRMPFQIPDREPKNSYKRLVKGDITRYRQKYRKGAS